VANGGEASDAEQAPQFQGEEGETADDRGSQQEQESPGQPCHSHSELQPEQQPEPQDQDRAHRPPTPLRISRFYEQTEHGFVDTSASTGRHESAACPPVCEEALDDEDPLVAALAPLQGSLASQPDPESPRMQIGAAWGTVASASSAQVRVSMPAEASEEEAWVPQEAKKSTSFTGFNIRSKISSQFK